MKFHCTTVFASKVIASYSGNWITLLFYATVPPLVLCCGRFDSGSSRVKRDSVDMVTVDL